jgi:hypothetical protein
MFTPAWSNIVMKQCISATKDGAFPLTSEVRKLY